MALVDENQMVVRQVIEQSGRRFARQAAGEMPRIVFDSVAISDLADHLQIEHGALIQALRFDQLALLLQFGMPPLQLFFDAFAAPARAIAASSRSASWDKWQTRT